MKMIEKIRKTTIQIDNWKLALESQRDYALSTNPEDYMEGLE